MKRHWWATTLAIAVVLTAVGSGASAADAAGLHHAGGHHGRIRFASSGTAGATALKRTNVWISSSRPWTETGTHVNFKAHVYPNKVGRLAISGTVTWSITGTDGSTIPCLAIVPMNRGGKSECRVGAAEFLRVNSPYTVTAAYSGDPNFKPSTGTFTEHIFRAEAKIRIVVSPKPYSGATTAVTAMVTAAPASALLSGTVWFKIASSDTAKGVTVFCIGPKPSPEANNGQPLAGGQATCNLPSGWFDVPKATPGDMHPSSKWLVTATYVDNSFDKTTRSMSGTARA